MLLGIGIDEIEVGRIARAIAHPRTGERFRRRVFTDAEARYCEGHRLRWQRYAARFAAKEAVAKALGTGIATGVRWRDIEICGGGGGPPRVQLHGAAARRAAERGIRRLLLSVTHTAGRAVAVVIAEGEEAAAE